MLSHAGRVLSYSATTLSERMAPGTTEFWMATWPLIAYWVVAGFYELLDRSNHPNIVRYRVTRKQPGKENPITRYQVLMRVLLQQALQTALGAIAILADPQQCPNNPPKGLGHSAVQFVLGMFIMDAYQYWIHRMVHVSTFLYKHVHSTHHRLLIPYAMGALYNHPLEALLLDTVGAGLSMYVAGMSCQLATYFFTFSTVKTVLDHSSYTWPLNPLHSLFPNCAAYHDVHHDIRGIKKNFSQPYFIHWDVLCGTYLDPAEFHLTQSQKDVRLAAGKQPTALAPADAFHIPDDPAVLFQEEVSASPRQPTSPSASSSSTVLETQVLEQPEQQLLEQEVLPSTLRARPAAAAARTAEQMTLGVMTRSHARHASTPQP